MLPTTIRSPPELGSYIPLEEYQSSTPETFFGGKPVLHHHLKGAKAWIPREQRASLPVFSSEPPSASAPDGASLNGVSEDLVEQSVDVYVNSENFILYSPAVGAGIEIPYPAISIHAIKSVGAIGSGSNDAALHAVWMQLEMTDGNGADDEGSAIDLTIVPPVADGAQSDTQKLYDAISSCSDLHPDPADEDDEEDEDDRIVFEGEHEAIDGFTGVMRGNSSGGLPPPFPGSGGWITAENVHEYFDADGNWIGGNDEEEDDEQVDGGVSGELGEGAGRVRAREEVNGHGQGEDEEDSENKRPRVDDPTPP